MSTRRKAPPHCHADGCTSPPVLGGLCEEHHAERAQAERKKRDAQIALHTLAVDDQPFQDSVINEEMLRLCTWWNDACSVIRFGTERRVPKKEAEYVLSWCTSLAQELVAAERRSREGLPTDSTELGGARHWVWERLHALEAGLNSTGTSRHG